MTKQFFIIVCFFFQVIIFGQNSEFKDTRNIIALKIYDDGMLQWTSVNESTKLPFIIEQFRWNKWIKIGEVNGTGVQGKNQYTFRPVPYHGENLFRVKTIAGSDIYKEAKWTSASPEIKFTIQKKTKEIKFSSETMYEIIDSSGKLIKIGYGLSISYEKIPKGKYVLNYDNLTSEFER